MQCPKCGNTMYEIDDCGDGAQGHECGVCGAVVSIEDEQCPEREEGYGHEWTDGPGGYTFECVYCGAER